MATILIAEDERDIRELIGLTLTFGGHKVVKAANGAEAVELASQVMPDLIMMDVRMPRMNGFEACVQLKHTEAVKHIPVVFLSAKGQESDFETGLDAGAYDFILKPFSPVDLIARINTILAITAAKKAEAKPAEVDSTIAAVPVATAADPVQKAEANKPADADSTVAAVPVVVAAALLPIETPTEHPMADPDPKTQ